MLACTPARQTVGICSSRAVTLCQVPCHDCKVLSVTAGALAAYCSRAFAKPPARHGDGLTKLSSAKTNGKGKQRQIINAASKVSDMCDE